MIIGSPPPVSVVRSIQDTYVPLTQRGLPGYSHALLQAVDRALALKMEDRPQSIDEFAALIEMPVAGIDDVLNVKQPGTMLVPVEETPEKVEVAGWQRYKLPALVAAGVIVGVIAGALLFSSSSEPEKGATETVNNSQPQQNSAPVEPPRQTEPVVQPTTQPAQSQSETPSAAPVASQAPIAQLFVRMNEGEKLTLNGESQSVSPATNGFASLKVKPGRYELVLEGNGQTRSQTVDIANPGTWLINPQPR
jgi:hypothetical protein